MTEGGKQDLTPQQRQARASILLSVQRALLDEVTPELRGVLMTWACAPESSEPTSIDAQFFYDSDIDDDIAEHVSEVEGYVAADFLEDLVIAFVPVHLSARRPLPRLTAEDPLTKDWVYRRFEE